MALWEDETPCERRTYPSSASMMLPSQLHVGITADMSRRVIERVKAESGEMEQGAVYAQQQLF